jgi:GMP synthase (glutamine-hydrolysing)
VHSQSVKSLPPQATLLARNDYDAHQAFRVGRNSWGLQFHPEFDDVAMRGYFDRLGEDLAKRGIDAAAKREEVVPTTAAASLLQRFAQLAAEQNKHT